MSDRALVIGGGIAGITSALVLRSRGWRVSLIERSHQLGGLLRSVRTEAGLEFDYGTHIPCSTGIAELDELLFLSMRDADWQSFNEIPAGVFFGGVLNTRSQFIDARRLPRETLAEVNRELIRNKSPRGAFATAEQQLEWQFGPTLTSAVFAPIMRKFFRRDLCELAPNAHLLFGLSSIVTRAEGACFPSGADQLSSEHSTGSKTPDGFQRTPRLYYPRKGGVGRWVKDLEQEMIEHDVRIYKGEAVKLSSRRNLVVGAELQSGKFLPCDIVVWTTSPATLLQQLKISGSTEPAPMTYTGLFHFVSRTAPLVDSAFVMCFDPTFHTFRVTIYSNLQCDSTEWRLTVESLSTECLDWLALAPTIATEVSQMGLVQSPEVLRLIFVEHSPGSFPIPLASTAGSWRSNVERAREVAANAIFIGKAMGKGFFMRDVLIHTYKTLASLSMSAEVVR